MSEENFTIERWLFEGKVKLKGNKVGVKFILLDEYNLTDKTMTYINKKTSYAPGCIYEVPVFRERDSCRAKLHELRLIEKHPDSSIVEKFQLQNKLLTISMESEKLEKKYAYGFELPENWQEIVRLYKGLSWTNRRAFESMLLAKLSKDSKTFE